MSQVLVDCLYEQRELPLINIFINIFLLFAHFIRLREKLFNKGGPHKEAGN